MKFLICFLFYSCTTGLPVYAADNTSPISAPDNKVSAVDCMSDDIASLDLSNDQLLELSKKCENEADELFKKATAAQDQGLISQTDAIKKSAEIAKTLRQQRMKSQKIKKDQELKGLKK